MVSRNEREQLNIPYHLLLERTDEGSVIIENNEILYINERGAKILGADSSKELIGMNIVNFLNMDDYDCVGSNIHINEALLKEDKYNIVNINDMKGQAKTIKSYLSRFTLEERTLMLAVFRDETLHLKQEMEAHLFRQAVDYSPIQIVMTDLQGRIEYINHAFEETMGYSRAEIIGRKPHFFQSGEHDQVFYKRLWNTISKGEIWRGYLKNQKKNGEKVWVSATITSIQNGDGEAVKYLALEEDISDKVDMAKSLEERNIELNKLVKELGEAQDQLIQKEKLAGIGELAAGVAHEINNPLGFIISNTTTLKSYVEKMMGIVDLTQQLIDYMETGETFERDATLDVIKEMNQKYDMDFIREDLSDLFSDMDEGLERVKKIVYGLRMFSRVDQNEVMAEYDINEGIKDTLVVANNEIKYDARVELELSEEIPSIQANGGQLNQVLLNLIINAVHAIREKSDDMGIIRIQTRCVNDFIECQISDTGTGIDENTAKKIFDPFFTTKPMGIGTGLGLSISYDIVTNKHEGYLRVDSKKGVGTDFFIGLPIKTEWREQENEESEGLVRR